MSLQVLVSDQSPSVDHCMAYALIPRNENPNNLTPRIVPRLQSPHGESSEND